MNAETTQKIGMSCLLPALVVGWFLALDSMGIRLELSLLGWAFVAPFLVYPLLDRLSRAAAARATALAELACSRRTWALLRHVRGRLDPSMRAIVDCCDRLISRSRTSDRDGRVSQEVNAIHYEILRLHSLSRTLLGAADLLGEKKWHEPISGQVDGAARLADSSLAESSRLAKSSRRV